MISTTAFPLAPSTAPAATAEPQWISTAESSAWLTGPELASPPTRNATSGGSNPNLPNPRPLPVRPPLPSSPVLPQINGTPATSRSLAPTSTPQGIIRLNTHTLSGRTLADFFGAGDDDGTPPRLPTTRPASPPVGLAVTVPGTAAPIAVTHILTPSKPTSRPTPSTGTSAPSTLVQPPRECLQWLRSLNLTTPVTPATLANGYLVAEIFSRYFPAASATRGLHYRRRADESEDVDGFSLYRFQNGCGTACKARNWAQLRRFLERRLALDLAPSVVALVSSGHRPLAWAVVAECWEALTGKGPRRPVAPLSTFPVADPHHLPTNLSDSKSATTAVFAHTLLPSPTPQSRSRSGRGSKTYALPTAASTLHTIPQALLDQARDAGALHGDVARLADAYTRSVARIVHGRK
ncbi:spermatogenesis-associated protein 4 [Blastocladiella emersonii ATCC 22665]|nr:spermatogenesis-associated protein 4 [Blastocladiella emersonii ATCC 22665]